MLDHLPADVMVTAARPQPETVGHARWVRVSHWLLTVSILTLAFTGFVILMAHPRLYWGETGNGLTAGSLFVPGYIKGLPPTYGHILRMGDNLTVFGPTDPPAIAAVGPGIQPQGCELVSSDWHHGSCRAGHAKSERGVRRPAERRVR